jgi:hypothetical protein
MGEAKRKQAVHAKANLLSKEMKRTRFDLYTLGTRLSMTRLRELSGGVIADHRPSKIPYAVLPTRPETASTYPQAEVLPIAGHRA